MKIEDIKVGQIVIDKDCERLGKLIISEIDKYDKVFVRTLDGAEEYYHYCVFNIASLVEVGIDDNLNKIWAEREVKKEIENSIRECSFPDCDGNIAIELACNTYFDYREVICDMLNEDKNVVYYDYDTDDTNLFYIVYNIKQYTDKEFYKN